MSLHQLQVKSVIASSFLCNITRSMLGWKQHPEEFVRPDSFQGKRVFPDHYALTNLVELLF